MTAGPSKWLSACARAAGRTLVVGLALLLSACDSPSQPSATKGPSGVGNDAPPKVAVKPDLGGPRLVILYATCSLNKDYLSPYNPEVEFTPNLAKFAEDSVTFARHQTEAGQSGVAYASIFTGTQADQHGAFFHPTILKNEMYLIFEAFADAGYETFFWCDHNMASPGLNYDQGLHRKNVFDGMLTAEHPEFLKILKKVKKDPTYRALIVTNFTVTHSNYNPKPLVDGFLEQYPDEIEDITYDEFKTYGQFFVKHAIPLSLSFPDVVARNNLNEVDVFKLSRTVEVMYKACVNELDRLFGAVVAQVSAHKLFDKSLIAFTSDHGEMLYRENVLFPFTHGYELPHEVLSVAWLVHAGGISVKPGVYEGVTRSIDVYPTLAGLSNIRLGPERGIAGVDLSQALRTGKMLELFGYSHTSLPNPYVLGASDDSLFKRYFPELDPELAWVCIRDGDMFYKWRNLDGTNWGYEFIDVANDPNEEHNLYDPANPKHREFAQRLTDYKAKLVNAYTKMWLWEDASGRQPAREDAIRRLKSLGYIK